MSEIIKEQLSALLDGELPVEEEELLLRRLQHSADCRATLVRYSMIGELLRGAEGSAPLSGRLLERVHEAVQAEPAPAVGPPPQRFRWGIPLAGAGLAATLALIVVFTLPAKDQRPAAAAPLAVSLTADRVDSRPVPRRRAIAAHRLTGYLVSHGDYAGSLSRQVMNSHIVNSTPAFLPASYPGAGQRD